MRSTHGGNLRALAERAGRRPEEVLDFSASINPLGPPVWLREELSRGVSGLVHYPDPHCSGLRAAAAARFGAAEAEVVAGNGSTELLFALVRALAPRRAVIPVPAYSDYAGACEAAGVPLREVTLRAEDEFGIGPEKLGQELQSGDMFFLGRPANPTGRLMPAREFAALAEAFPGVLFVADEAFLDFCQDTESLSSYHLPNVIVLYSLTKSFAVPGLRLGLAMAPETIAAEIVRQVPPWSVNGLAQAVGERALADKDFLERSRGEVAKLASELRKGLMQLPGLRVFPSRANYMLCRLEEGDAEELADRLLMRRGIALRTCAGFQGLDQRYFRLAVRKEDENESLLEALGRELGARARGRRGVRRVPAIMVQGTGSNAGKSVIACALCRIFLQDGLSPAPFKAQNMSLNSFVTGKGEEMGRAQATQAAACRRDPDVRMNPVLLKPGSDTGSQVIVMGRPVGNMSVEEYLAYKPEAKRAVEAAYASLAAEAGVMVLEGAGSPAEINLKAHDIVNMAMARHARAGVLLIGDIDRGGVFAHFTGTLELLDEADRASIGALLINRFRGQESLLAPAMRDVAYRTGTPFAGVLPYMPDLGLPEEDSVSFKAGRRDETEGEADLVIACVDLPRVSNFTDLDALALEPDVRVRVLRRAGELDPEDPPDAIILPGSKNVAGDLEYLRAGGWAERIAGCLGRSEIVGLCAGYQMLGETLLDPGGLESDREKAPGLGLLPLSSELAPDKTLKLVRAEHAASGLEMRGYEIHHGVSEAGAGSEPVVCAEDGRVIGHGVAGNRVWGTYLHGAFDADEFRRWFLDRLREHKGLAPLGRVVAVYDLEPALDRLADTVRERLDMELIYSLAGL